MLYIWLISMMLAPNISTAKRMAASASMRWPCAVSQPATPYPTQIVASRQPEASETRHLLPMGGHEGNGGKAEKDAGENCQGRGEPDLAPALGDVGQNSASRLTR